MSDKRRDFRKFVGMALANFNRTPTDIFEAEQFAGALYDALITALSDAGEAEKERERPAFAAAFQFDDEFLRQVAHYGNLHIEDSQRLNAIADRYSALEAQLAEVEKERDALKLAKNDDFGLTISDFMRDALVALAGAVSTPEKGYLVEGGLRQMLRDIQELRRRHDRIREAAMEVCNGLEALDIQGVVATKLTAELTPTAS